jgi:hypothetical protein
MTNQTKRFIELSDIIGLQLECKKCGVSLLAGGSTLTATLVDPNNVTLARCPTCNADWTVASGFPRMAYDTEVKKFLRMIETMRSIEGNIGCRIRFEIKVEASSAPAS